MHYIIYTVFADTNYEEYIAYPETLRNTKDNSL